MSTQKIVSAASTSPAGATKPKNWTRSENVWGGWYEVSNPNTVHQTRDGLPPADDMRNVSHTVTSIGKTHGDKSEWSQTP